MFTLTLDIVAEIEFNAKNQPVDIIFGDDTKFSDDNCGLTFEVNNYNGAGGWPEITLQGTRENIESWVRKYYAADEEHLAYEMSFVKEK